MLFIVVSFAPQAGQYIILFSFQTIAHSAADWYARAHHRQNTTDDLRAEIAPLHGTYAPAPLLPMALCV